MNIINLLRSKYYRTSLCSKEKRVDYLRSTGVKIGNGCDIFPIVDFGSEPYLVTIGNRVKITTGVSFITHDGGVHVLRNMDLLPNADIFGKIIVNDNVFIGVNSTIMPGVEIGENSIIGLGSVVTKNIPPNSVVAGVPARVIRDIHSYYEKYKDRIDYTKSMSPEEKRKYITHKYSNKNKTI